MNAQPQVIIIEEDTDGHAVIDVVQSVAPYRMPVDGHCNENNIQATLSSMQFESVSVHGDVHQSTVHLMRHKLVSRLKAHA